MPTIQNSSQTSGIASFPGLRQALAYNVETASIIPATVESLEWARYGRKHGLKKFLEKRDGPFKSSG